MKTLEQLGISPAPWNIVPYGERTNSKVATHGDVEFAKGESAFMKDGGAQLQEIANARLIAASPDLYEALAAMLSCAEKEAPFTAGSGMSVAIDMARKAIKKAGGE